MKRIKSDIPIDDKHDLWVKPNCKHCYGRGIVGFNIGKMKWEPCKCALVKRIPDEEI